MIVEPLKEFLGPTKYAEYLEKGKSCRLFGVLRINELTNEELIVLLMMREADHQVERMCHNEHIRFLSLI